MQNIRAQNKTEEATAVQQQFEEAWKYVDVKLTASQFWSAYSNSMATAAGLFVQMSSP